MKNLNEITASEIISRLNMMSLEDLRAINKAAFDRIQNMRSVVKATFFPGQTVSFQNRYGETVKGVVLSKGPKNIVVLVGSVRWRVAPFLLKAV